MSGNECFMIIIGVLFVVVFISGIINVFIYVICIFVSVNQLKTFCMVNEV